MDVSCDVPLAPRTTLGVGGVARRFGTVTSIDELRDALADAAAIGEPVLVLAGGSNLVVRDGGWHGLAVAIALPGIAIVDDGDTATVTAAAGVVWDDLVAQCLDAGLAGVECLSGIPGLVGATPMQNVGAYGQEVADTIEWVRVLDRHTGQLETFRKAACGFAYRTSLFKGSTRWIVVEVQFRLARDRRAAPLRYPELSRALGVADGGRAPLADVRRTVIELRRGKGMVVDAADPESRSAGSFFVNPIVNSVQLAALESRLPAGTTMPRFAASGGLTKLSAGWLIEHAGFAKGYTVGRVGISRKHALALVNRGGATTTELLALAHEIQQGVHAAFGIELVPEPVIVGVD
ncbi:MAG: UDP-N-acetylmuramate dehydrogenase [Deltaproteobacteria bacterium]|nr:UDP-N-acetylmuramate dehydrogenase [Deltaproteobacteria bacterium]MDQ3295373.1 UDP-N-acetylmuramate dehydrogenase [Myxococcota bacterium]